MKNIIGAIIFGTAGIIRAFFMEIKATRGKGVRDNIFDLDI